LKPDESGLDRMLLIFGRCEIATRRGLDCTTNDQCCYISY